MRPLILDYKQKRVETDTEIIYEYDHELSLNIVNTQDGKRPFIELNVNDVELLTKTKAQRETDDEHFLFELSTKTEVRKERDDLHDSLIEFQTKTFTQRERDDQ